ncbi:hypothetical protein Tco_1135087 [Tanacetum coccineum]
MKPKEPTYQVVLDALALTTYYLVFLITADVLILGQEFDAPPFEEETLFFIRELGHSGEIKFITDVSVEYLHQPWRDFATIINKCLSGKELAYQIDNKDAKKTNKMSYPRFTTIIIDYFMSKGSVPISREKQDVFATRARDDDHVLKELTNQTMLESNAYKTYNAFASGKKTPKPKYVRKKANPDTSPKQKLVQDTNSTRLKSKAKVSKSDKKKQPAKKLKAKGLAVLSEVALTEAEQLKLDTKRSKKDFHISHASESGVLDVPTYESKSEKESWGNSDEEDDDDSDDNDESDDESTESDRDEIPDPNKTNAEHNEEEEEYDDEFNIKEEEKIADEESMDE